MNFISGAAGESDLARQIRSQIGRVFPSHTASVEKERIATFARAIGETSPIYFDEDTARAAGYAGIPVPPTFLFSLSIDKPRPFDSYEEIGIDQTWILHAEQSFAFSGWVHVGARLTFTTTLKDAFEKRSGALLFVVKETAVSDQNGANVAILGTTVAIRRGSTRE